MSYASSPIAASAFSEDSEVINSQVILTGVSVVFTPGDPFIEGDAIFLTTGVEASANIGQATGEPESIYPVTGEQITSSLGTSIIQANADTSVTGLQSDTETGSLDHTGSALATPTGLNIQFTEGTIERALEQSFQPGNTFAGASFASDEVINSEAILVGINSTIALNNVDLVTDNNIQVTPPSDQMETFLGIALGEAESIYPLTGVEITTNLDDPVISGSAPVPVTGEEIETSLGNEVVIANSDVEVTGLGMQFDDGDPTIVADALVELTGLSIVSSTGTLSQETIYALTGVSMQFDDGTATVVANADVPLTGIEISSFVGNMRSTPWANVATNANNTWTPVVA